MLKQRGPAKMPQNLQNQIHEIQDDIEDPLVIMTNNLIDNEL